MAVWNVAGNADAFDGLAAYSPDVVLVQECVKPQRGWPGYSWHFALDPAILSRLPVQPLPTESIGPWTDPQLAIVTLASGRRVLFVNVRLALPSLIITAANLSGFELPGNHQQRIDQFPRLRSLIEKTAAREGVADIVVGGDFNSPATGRSLAPLRAMLRDVWLEAGVGWGGTAPEFLPLARIDQCWVSAQLRPLQARVVRLPGSDHRALLVDLALNAG